MKIGLLTLVLSRNLDYDQVVEWAGSGGFENLEIDVRCSAFPQQRGLLNTTELLSGGRRAVSRCREALERNGLTAGSLMYYMLNNLDPNIEARQRVQAGLKEAIRVAALLGAQVVVTSIGSHLIRHDSSRLNPWGIYYHGMENADGTRAMEEGFEVFAENYLPVAGFARDHGVKIALEPSAIGGGAGAVAYSPETFDRLFEVANHEALGLNFDPSHFLWQGIDFMAYAGRLAREGRIFSCHGKDNEILWSRVKVAGFLSHSWWRHRIPGWGQVNWPDLIKTLQVNGYDWVINVEHEDPLLGFQFDQQGGIVDIELAKKGCLMGLEYLKHARSIAGL